MKDKGSFVLFILFLLVIDRCVCDVKSSLTFVIDNTASMTDDIDAVKVGANAIFDTVMRSNSSHVEDFVLVTFNDPNLSINHTFQTDLTSRDNASHAKRPVLHLFVHVVIATQFRAKTKDRSIFKKELRDITLRGNPDCPEMAMAGIIQGIQNSREGSTIYVFTDASAKDYEKYEEVEALSQKMGCQIVFVLTGICYGDKKAPEYVVYNKLAKATNGQVFHLQKSEIGEILKYVQNTIESRKNILTSKIFAAGHGKFDVPIDGDTKELVIAVSGERPSFSVTDSRGTTWPTTNITRLSEIAVVKVVGVTPGLYTVQVRSKGETHVVVSGTTSVHFQHGFSTISPSDIKDTVTRPVPGVKSHLSIKLSTDGGNLELHSVQILDMNDNVISETPLKIVNKAEQFYKTEQIIPPDHMFKVAIKGYDVNSKTFLTRISLTPVKPQEIKPGISRGIYLKGFVLMCVQNITAAVKRTPEVECDAKVNAAYDKPVELKCKVSGYPKPDVIWETDDKSAFFSHFVSLVPTRKENIIYSESIKELPYDYITVLTINNVRKNSTYTCQAANSAGSAESSTVVETKMERYFKVIAFPKDDGSHDKILVFCSKQASDVVKGNTGFLGDGTFKLTKLSETVTKCTDKLALFENRLTTAETKIELLEEQKLVNHFLQQRVSELEEQINNQEQISTQNEIEIMGVNESPQENPVHLALCVAAKIGLALKEEDVDSVTRVDTIIEYQKSVRIPCKIKAFSPAKVSWYKGGRPLRPDGNLDVSEDGSVLTIRSMEPKMADNYICEARNDVRRKIFKFSVDISGVEAPEINKRITSITAVKNSEVDIPCQFDAISSDEGEYECEASNTHGVDRIIYKLHIYGSFNIVLFSLSVPVDIESPANSLIEQMEGSRVTLPCRADGSPKPSITWIYHSKDAKVGPSRIRPSDNTGRLSFDRIQLRQSGEYTCVATNSRSSKNITYEVSVLAPPKIYYTTKEFHGVVGDMVLRIPCNATGNPKPEITWTMEGYHLASGTKWYDISADGSLIIKNIKEISAGYYSCKASNDYGQAEEEFDVVVDDFPDLGFRINKFKLTKGDSAMIPCDVPRKKPDRLLWFKDGRLLPSSDLAFRVLSESDSGTYTCRVSSMDRPAMSGSTTVEVGFKPQFEYPVYNKNISFVPGEFATIDCTAAGLPKPEVQWYHNNRPISYKNFKYVLDMYSDYDKGRYTCIVRNSYGTVQREFVVSSFGCLLSVKHDFSKNEPLMLTSDNKVTNFKTRGSYMNIPKDETIKLVCPSSFNTIPLREMLVTCENAQQFLHQSSGRRYAYSDLKCRDKWKPIVKRTGRRCAKRKAEILNVGFETGETFETVYEVCFARDSKNPIYTKLDLQPSLANSVTTNDTVWFHYGSPVDLGGIYDCSNQNAETSAILNKEFHTGDGCCFAKRMLVNPLDVAPGLQGATYTHLNIVPHWGTCNSKNWEEVERRIRNLVASSDRTLQVFTGTGYNLQLTDSFSRQRNVVLNSRGKGIQVPRYLWKAIQDPSTKTSLAIIQVNVPDLSLSSVRSYQLCNDVCKNVKWMQTGHWRNVSHGFTYCCSLADFERAFRYQGVFPDFKKLLRA
ncbi:hemicentin-2-like [Cydia splendana]|uniref:hemicentin-2-like n=1 Tax=Cydia splendana TaxID=1100963 RepID=UPI00300D5698